MLDAGADPRELDLNYSGSVCSIFEHLAKSNNTNLFVKVVKQTIEKYGKIEFHPNDINAQNLWNKIVKLQKSFDSNINLKTQDINFTNTKIGDSEPGVNFDIASVLENCDHKTHEYYS